MKKKLILTGMVAALALGGVFYAYTYHYCAAEVQASTVTKEDDCCKADEAKAQTASMSMGCCEEKKEAK